MKILSRVNPTAGVEVRTTSVSSASSITPNLLTTDIFAVTALAENILINNPTGTPFNGQRLIFRITNGSTQRNITWGSAYVGVIEPLPVIMPASRTMYMGFIYNSFTVKWDLVAISLEF